ncbi:MAG TPA: hypothetical protein VK545_12520 [Streptomyces sp.]|nr:hypothetical protein [Streptomyces sp.]
MTIELVGDLVLAALAVRVFGQDALAALRRAAATGVRVGVRELRRTTGGQEQR